MLQPTARDQQAHEAACQHCPAAQRPPPPHAEQASALFHQAVTAVLANRLPEPGTQLYTALQLLWGSYTGFLSATLAGARMVAMIPQRAQLLGKWAVYEGSSGSQAEKKERLQLSMTWRLSSLSATCWSSWHSLRGGWRLRSSGLPKPRQPWSKRCEQGSLSGWCSSSGSSCGGLSRSWTLQASDTLQLRMVCCGQGWARSWGPRCVT